MKKIALISVWNHNYGSLLQTYALQTFLNSYNMGNEIILYRDKGFFRRIIRFTNLSYLVAKFKVIFRNCFVKLFYLKIKKNIDTRSTKFEEFKNTNLYFSKPVIGRNRLYQYIKGYRATVLGSDQVLHPANLLMDYFTLNFVPKDIKKIAYAPSFGVSDIPFYQLKRTKSYLNRFDYLSVREVSGQKIIKKLINKDVAVVCDPTLLIEKKIWDKLKGSNRIIPDQYIFCYYLGDNRLHRDFANRLKKTTGLKIVALQHLDEFVKKDLVFGDLKPFDIGPAEFVNLLSNAEYVLTDSFHATIFSLIYNKIFFTFNRYITIKETRSTNSRISSLLGQLNLLDRKLIGNENISDCLQKTINYIIVETKIKKIKELSAKYLLDALRQ